MSNIESSFHELEAGIITWHLSKKEFRAHLGVVWELPHKEAIEQAPKKAHSTPNKIKESPSTPYVSKQNWLFGCSTAFEKSVQKFDAKLRGRFLTCMMKIVRAPTTPIGDTVKPLEGDKKGLWRYREGDYRILYFPDKSNLRVMFVDVDSRGEIYK